MKSKISLHEPTLKGNEINYLKKSIQSSWLSQSGPFVKSFEKKIYRLQRTHIGPLHMDSLKLGEWRCLKPSEMKILRKYISKNAVDSEDE